ncbi:unnamed protein product [Closterium sp. NIES-53]
MEAAEGVAAVAAVGPVVVGLDLGVQALVVVGASSSSVGARPRRPSSSTCGRYHTERCCFARLDDAWRAEFGDDVERPRWAQLLQSGVPIFDINYDVIISAMYDLSFSAEGDCYWCVPPDADIAAAALGASVSGTPPGTAPVEALHTFTLDSGASRCFFRDSTTLTPLPTPVPVSLLSLHLFRSDWLTPLGARSLPVPQLSSRVRRTAALQDAMVTTTTPGGSSLYTMATEPPQVAASAQVPASGQVAASCSCRLLSHQTLLWHHRLGHPSLPRLRGIHSHLLVSGLPRSLPPLPPSPAPPYLPCVEGQQRAAPHSSSFPQTTAPLQTLHIDVWGPARVSGQGRERYFLLVVDDYTRYTTVFPLRSKGEVSAVLIPWIRTVRLQLHEWFGQDLPVLRLHSDRGGDFSSDLLRDFCRGEGITQTFTLPDSPQQNGIAERRIGLVMEVARTSMIHAAAPHFLWSFAVRYAAHQLNLWPRVSLLETSPTLRWTGKVGDASVFRVWGSRAFVRDTSADKLSTCATPCVFLGFAPDAPRWQFYHPTSRRVLPSHDVLFDELVPFFRLFPYHSAPPPPLPLFLAPGPPPVDPLPPQGAAPGAASGGVASGGAACGGAASGGAEPGGAGSEGAGSGGAEPEGVELGGAESESADSGGAEPRGAVSFGGPAGASPRQSSQQLREWLVQHAHRRSGAHGAGRAGETGAGGAVVTTGAGGPGGTATTGPGGARTSGAGAARTGGVGCTGAGDPTEPGAASARGAGAGVAGVGGPGAGGAWAAGAGAVDPGAGGAGGIVRPRPYFVPLLQHVLASPLPIPSPYTEQSGGLTEHREPGSRPVSPVCTARRTPRSRPPPVPSTHTMALRPSSVPLRVPLSAPPESSLPEVPDTKSDLARAAGPTISRLLSTAIIDPSFESAAASALVAELLDFAAACRLDYASALVAESVPASPPSVGGECALGTDVLEDRVKRLPGSPPAFKARYVARGFSQRQGVDYFQTFSPTPKMTTLQVLLHVATQRDYELHSLDFSTAILQCSLHEEIWLRQPHGFTGTFPAGTQWSLRRPVYSLRQASHEWHDTLRTTLAALGFAPSTADPSLFLRTDTLLPPFYVLVYIDDLVLQRFGFQYSSPQLTPLSTSHSLSTPPSDESVELSGPYLEPDAAKRVLRYLCSTSGMGLVLGGRGPVVLTGHADAFWVDDSATQRSSQGYTFSLGSGLVSWRSTCSSSVLSSSCKAEIYAGAMAAQELRWLTYLLTDLGEQPRSPPVLYHRGQLHLAYVATRANTADVFTKALPRGDHQRFATVLGLVPTLPHLLTA